MKPQLLKRAAKKMRANPTRSEKALMDKLQGWGVRFRFQYIVGPYVADFYLPEYHLIVEVDGSSHYSKRGVLRDLNRTAYLEKQGYQVLRIPNELVDKVEKATFIESALRFFTMQPVDAGEGFYKSYLESLSV